MWRFMRCGLPSKHGCHRASWVKIPALYVTLNVEDGDMLGKGGKQLCKKQTEQSVISSAFLPQNESASPAHSKLPLLCKVACSSLTPLPVKRPALNTKAADWQHALFILIILSVVNGLERVASDKNI